MLRFFFTIVLPLLLPTAVYLLWQQFARWPEGGDGVHWNALPWAWLAGVGALLLVMVLSAVIVGFGTSQPGAYVPPRLENGRIIPGHIAPQRSP